MKNRFAQNPQLLNEMGERTLESYRKDPTLAARMGQARKKFYENNPEARARSAEIVRDLAKRRRALHDELESLAATYHSRTGKPFPLPTRSEGGWQEAVMLGIMEQLTGLLADGGK